MTRRHTIFGVFIAILMTFAALQAADVSRQAADSFAKKVAIISQQGALPPARPAAAARRTPVSEAEVNSWFAYRAQPLLPKGVTQPQVTIIGNGKVMGLATVDLEAIGKQKSSGGTFDPWKLLGGRVPVAVTGVLQTKAGKGRFQLQDATVSGVPVPKSLLQQLVSYYSRTTEKPDGLSLDDPFQLPANIQQIEVGQGQAVVVQ
jgi:hypothetical protein